MTRTSSFGTCATPLKWDAAAWRHFPDSPSDARFLDALEALRKPPANLNLKKYVDCVRIGALRAYRSSNLAMKAQISQAFWSQVQKKIPALVLSDDIPTLLPDVQGMPTSAAPLAAADWQNALLDAMRVAQRSRPIYRLPSPAQQMLLAMRSWERLNTTEPPLGIEQAPPWLRVYVAMRLAATQSSASLNPALLAQWDIELGLHSAKDVASIASHLCRDPESFNSAMLREASFRSLAHLGKNAESVAEVVAALAVGGAALDNAPVWAERIAPSLDTCVMEYSRRFSESPLLVAMLNNRGWNSDGACSHWHHLAQSTRRAQAELALDYLLEHAQEPHCFPDEDATFWRFMEQELRALRPWNHDLVEKVAQTLPAMVCCKSIAVGLDPDMEIVQTMGGPWLASWRQLRSQKHLSMDVVEPELFAEYQTGISV